MARRRLAPEHGLRTGPAWAALALAMLGLVGSFALLILGFIVEGFGRGMGAVH